MDVDRDNVIAHNHGWKGSNAYASQATGQPDMFAGAGEVEEAVANRLPNEIIMNVSHSEISSLCLVLFRIDLLDPSFRHRYERPEKSSPHLASLVSMHGTRDLDQAGIQF